MRQAGSWAGWNSGRRLCDTGVALSKEVECNFDSPVSGEPVIILFPKREDETKKKKTPPDPSLNPLILMTGSNIPTLADLASV